MPTLQLIHTSSMRICLKPIVIDKDLFNIDRIHLHI